MITIRIDVDYAYPSRVKSFVYTLFRIKSKKDYLKYSKMLACLINQSSQSVKAYWFFNPCTFPDAEMLELLKSDRHEIGLHVINYPDEELLQLESLVKRKIHCYTIHGTARLIGQIVWHRKLGQKQAEIPKDFRLQSFHEFPTYCLDHLCYRLPETEAIAEIKEWLQKDYFLEVHPEWLTQRGRINHRGPYLNVLKNLLTSPSLTT